MLTRQSLPFAVALTALAGYTDAIGFLVTHGFFVSFMSGNSTRLGVGLVEDIPAFWLAGVLVVAFVAGAMLGSLAVRIVLRHQSVVALAVVTAFLVLAAATGSLGYATAAAIPIALAMGAENSVFHKNGETTIALTYMTGALVKVGQRVAAAVMGGDKLAFAPYFALWMGLVAGGVGGAAAYRFIGMPALWVAAAAAAALALYARYAQFHPEVAASAVS
jgi:uncharacterized membrane protein YoaK (UPF0700 family)